MLNVKLLVDHVTSRLEEDKGRGNVQLLNVKLLVDHVTSRLEEVK